MPSRRAVLRSLGVATAAGASGCVGTEDPATAEPPANDTPTERPGTGTSDTESSGTGEPDTPTPTEDVDGEWPTPAHDPGRSNHASGSAGPTDPVGELWRVTADGTLSDPVLADGTLYVGTDGGAVRAIDAATGADRWRTPVDGAAGTPRVLGDALVVPTAGSSASGALVALDAGDGGERWRVETHDRAALLAAEHGTYVLSDGEDGPPTLVARDPADGSKRWRVELGDPWEAVLLATDDAVLVPTGTRFGRPWLFDPATGDPLVPPPDASGHHFDGVRYVLDGTAYATDPFYGSVSAHSLTDGGYDSRWHESFDAPGGRQVAGDAERLYGHVRGDPGGIRALSTADGSTVWTAEGIDEPRSRPVVAGEALLVRTDEGLHCLDPADGSERWTHPGDGLGDRVLVADDLVYTTRGNFLRALRPP